MDAERDIAGASVLDLLRWKERGTEPNVERDRAASLGSGLSGKEREMPILDAERDRAANLGSTCSD